MTGSLGQGWFPGGSVWRRVLRSPPTWQRSQNPPRLKKSKIKTRRIGANPEKSDLVNFRGPDWRKFSELCVLLFFLGKTDKMLPKSRFSKPIFGHSVGSTKLDRPYCKRFWKKGVSGRVSGGVSEGPWPTAQNESKTSLLFDSASQESPVFWLRRLVFDSFWGLGHGPSETPPETLPVSFERLNQRVSKSGGDSFLRSCSRTLSGLFPQVLLKAEKEETNRENPRTTREVWNTPVFDSGRVSGGVSESPPETLQVIFDSSFLTRFGGSATTLGDSTRDSPGDSFLTFWDGEGFDSSAMSGGAQDKFLYPLSQLGKPFAST